MDDHVGQYLKSARDGGAPDGGTPGRGHAVPAGVSQAARAPRARPLAGTVVTLPDVALAELTASFADFVWIDLEHGALDVGDVPPLAIAARAGGAAAYARLRDPRDAALGPLLDAGVDGVVVPRVESAADAERVVRRFRYPPDGTRGIAARRASGYGIPGDAPAPVCTVQIETSAALAEAEAIAAVEGVTSLVVGCADLRAALGRDDIGPAIAAVRRAARRAGVGFGVAGPDDPELLLELAGPGADLLVLGADVRLYARALDGAFGRLSSPAPTREEAHVGA